MNETDQVITFMRESGDRIRDKAGQLRDIGITKQFVTEEDIRIEREFKELIQGWGTGDVLFAEEENADLPDTLERVWVVDPISGTKTFLEGLPHYAIVVSQMLRGDTVFAAVYDPSTEELFTAYKDGGAYVNGEKIHVNEQSDGEIASIVLDFSSGWKGSITEEDARKSLSEFKVTQNKNSFAVNYCYVACGRFDGVVAFTKDIFPDCAGSLMIREAGGVFTNQKNEPHFALSDRRFVGGPAFIQSALLKAVQDL